MKQPEFLPTSREEMNALGWDELDVLLISGDAYVDHHSFACALLGRWLVENGFRAGIVPQPAWDKTDDVTRMGRPRLFAGVSAGALDSLVAHYTAFRKKRSDDAYSPGGVSGLRPNRATIAYTGLLRQAFPGLPVVAGGIEASLRRASQYDFWSDSLRRSIVLDSKADAVFYGMGERSILALAELLRDNPVRTRPADAIARARLAGSAYAVHPEAAPEGAVELPSHEAILAEPALLIKATLLFEEQMLRGGPCLVQRSGGRAVVFEVPPAPLTTEEMDRIYAMPFTRRAHPSYAEPIPAVAMIEDSVTSHRGCGGGCSFCSLALHQGRTVQSRSEQSIVDEIIRMTKRPEWKGSISDVGGPSANMWDARCAGDRETCKRDSCLYPKKCRNFKADQDRNAALLRRIAAIPGVEHLRVASGVRHDLALDSDAYMQALVGEFTGGQLKIAPEHIADRVLRMMRKPPKRLWETFIKAFERLSAEAGKEQYIIPYLMSAFPGCTDDDMRELAAWLGRRGWRPQQIQCFIPTPGTVATAMFFAGQDVDGRPIRVARTDAHRLRQHRLIQPDAEAPAVPAPRPVPRSPARPPSSGRDRRPGGPRSSGSGFDKRSRPRPDRPGQDRPDWKKSGGRSEESADRPRSFGDRRRPDDRRSGPRPDRDRSGESRPDWRKTGDGRSGQSGGSGDRPRSFGDRRRPADGRSGQGRPDWKKSGGARSGGRPGESGDRPRPFGDRKRSDDRRSGGGRSGPGDRKRPGGGRGGPRP